MRTFVFIASAKIPEREGSISACSFHGELPDYKSYIFCFAFQVDEFSFKEMRTFLCFFGSNVGILNIIMLIQILFYRSCKQHVHSRRASCKTRIRNMCTFKQFLSRLNGLPKVAG